MGVKTSNSHYQKSNSALNEHNFLRRVYWNAILANTKYSCRWWWRSGFACCRVFLVDVFSCGLFISFQVMNWRVSPLVPPFMWLYSQFVSIVLSSWVPRDTPVAWESQRLTGASVGRLVKYYYSARLLCMFIYYYIAILHDQFHLLSLLRSLVGHNFPLFFPRKKKHPWSWKNVWDICRQPFWSLNSLDVGCSPGELVDESFKWSSLSLSHGLLPIINHVVF